MKESRHPNVLHLWCSFMVNDTLWMVMPFIGGGSIYDIMQEHFPEVLHQFLCLSRFCRSFAWSVTNLV